MAGERRTPWRDSSGRGSLPNAAAPWVALAASLALTLAGTIFLAWSARERDRARFQNAVESAEDRIRARLELYVTALSAGSGLFASSREVRAAEFRTFVEKMELRGRFPGVQGIGYSAVVPAAGRSDTILARLRAEGIPIARLWPDSARGERHAILYLEPMDARNRAALGFDMATEPTRREAMHRARDGGGPALSGRVRLVQEISGRVQSGFLIYYPVYEGGVVPATVAERRARLRGFVYSPFRADDLFRGIFGTESEPRAAFHVHDGPTAAPDALLHDSHAAGVEPSARPAFTVVRRMDFAGRTWTLVFASRSAFESGSLIALTPLLFVAGLLVSLVVFRLARGLARARDAAERSQRVRSRFFADMSHELRTPINAIMGYNDLILAEVYGLLTPQQRHGIERSQRAARHLRELVDDVLDLSKIEAGKIELALEDVSLPALLDDLEHTIRPMAEARGCALRVDASECARPVCTDPRRLRQILLNLLSNATKFGAGRPVSVRCRQDERWSYVEVHDEGPGIPEEQHARIFDEFVQLAAEGEMVGGTGLGLSIARRLARLLGGRLEIESAVGEGSNFRVVIPG